MKNPQKNSVYFCDFLHKIVYKAEIDRTFQEGDSFDVYLQETNYFDIDSMFGFPKDISKKELTDIIVANLLEYIAEYIDQHIITDYNEHIFDNLELLKIY